MRDFQDWQIDGTFKVCPKLFFLAFHNTLQYLRQPRIDDKRIAAKQDTGTLRTIICFNQSFKA